MNFSIAGKRGEIATNEGEIVLIIKLSYTPDALEGGFIPKVATQSIGGISRIDDNSPLQQYFYNLPDRSGLRVNRMNLYKILILGNDSGKS